MSGPAFSTPFLTIVISHERMCHGPPTPVCATERQYAVTTVVLWKVDDEVERLMLLRVETRSMTPALAVPPAIHE